MDRLRGVLTIFWAAYQSRRILLIDWTHPRPLEETLLPALYDWRFHGPCDAEMSVPYGPADNQLALVDAAKRESQPAARTLSLRLHPLAVLWWRRGQLSRRPCARVAKHRAASPIPAL